MGGLELYRHWRRVHSVGVVHDGQPSVLGRAPSSARTTSVSQINICQLRDFQPVVQLLAFGSEGREAYKRKVRDQFCERGLQEYSRQ